MRNLIEKLEKLGFITPFTTRQGVCNGKNCIVKEKQIYSVITYYIPSVKKWLCKKCVFKVVS